MELVALGFFTVAFGLAAIFTPLARRLALALKLVDRPLGRKGHDDPVPYLGGLAIVCAFAVTFALIFLLPHTELYESWPLLAAYGPKDKLFDPTILRGLGWIALGGGVIFLLGLADDRFSLSPWIKLSVEIAVATILALLGVRIDFYGPVASTILSVLWVVGITNAFNFLDNMDGLSAGVAVICAAMFFVVTVQTDQLLVGITCITLAGAAAGFLLYNFHPARIFMGDAGSLYLGFMLACLTMATRYYHYNDTDTVLRLAMPVLIMGLPLFDAASVVWIRLRQGRPLFQGDRNHFSHRLVALGMSTREAVLTNYLVAAATGLGAMLLIWVSTAGGLIILAQALLIFSIVLLLERAGKRKP